MPESALRGRGRLVAAPARRRWAGALLVVLTALFVTVSAAPVQAHAELVSSTPADGARVDRSPPRVQLRFTESVRLIDGGLSLLGPDGTPVDTPGATARGSTVSWPMPQNLPRGRYLVSWRVISADGHPVSGAFSFGVGVSLSKVDDSGAAASTAPWPVVVWRLVGYAAFSLVAGGASFLLWCAPGLAGDRRARRVVGGGLLGGLVATLGSLLVQGPYVSGRPFTELFSPAVLAGTLATPFGLALIVRLALYGVLGGLAGRAITGRQGRLRLLRDGVLAIPALVAIAATFAAAGHGAASGRTVDLAVHATHALTAGVWVGGLVMLLVLRGSLGLDVLRRFSGLALVSVALLVVTGVANSLRELDEVTQLWSTRYGALLLVKLAVVALALAAAGWSRRTLAHDAMPRRSVRVEGLAVVGVLVLTSALSMTSPPPEARSAPVAGAAALDPLAPASTDATARFPLNQLGSAELHLTGTSTRGSDLHLVLRPAVGVRLTKVTLQASLPARDLGPIDVPLTQEPGALSADYRFPLPGKWRLALAVEDSELDAVVSTDEVIVSDP